MLAKTTTRSHYQDSNNLVDKVVAALESGDKGDFQYALETADQQISQEVADYRYRTCNVPQELYLQPGRTLQLTVPKANSLTDNLLRSTLGPEEKLAKSYMQIVASPSRSREEERRRKQEEAKRKYANSSGHRDLLANGKPFMGGVRLALQRPVIDNEHDSYLKTQLIFLEQPKGDLNAKEYFDKHADMIAKKINELGGIEDTIGRMEDSLSRNEVRGFKKKQVLANMSRERKGGLFSPSKGEADSRLGGSWVNRSREMRESFIARMHIQ